MSDKTTAPKPWKQWKGGKGGWKTTFWWFEWCCEVAVYHLNRWAFVELLETAGRFVLLFTIVTYLLTRDAQLQQERKLKHFQAWQVLNTAFGKTGDGGRRAALHDLIEDGEELYYINLAETDLSHADLRGARLTNADLTNTYLGFADLRNASLSGVHGNQADFVGAKLVAADFFQADLRSGWKRTGREPSIRSTRRRLPRLGPKGSNLQPLCNHGLRLLALGHITHANPWLSPA